jgi:hypothetical protein
MKQNASSILIPIAKCPEAIKAHRTLASTDTTSSDVFPSEEDSRGYVNYVKLIANNDCNTHDYRLFYEDMELCLSDSLQIFEEKETVESFSCEILLGLYLSSSRKHTAHCTLTTMDIFFRLGRVSYRSSLCGYAWRVLIKIYRHFGGLIRIT